MAKLNDWNTLCHYQQSWNKKPQMHLESQHKNKEQSSNTNGLILLPLLQSQYNHFLCLLLLNLHSSLVLHLHNEWWNDGLAIKSGSDRKRRRRSKRKSFSFTAVRCHRLLYNFWPLLIKCCRTHQNHTTFAHSKWTLNCSPVDGDDNMMFRLSQLADSTHSSSHRNQQDNWPQN